MPDGLIIISSPIQRMDGNVRYEVLAVDSEQTVVLLKLDAFKSYRNKIGLIKTEVDEALELAYKTKRQQEVSL